MRNDINESRKADSSRLQCQHQCGKHSDIYSSVTVKAYVNVDAFSEVLNCTDAIAFRLDPVSFGS